MDHYRSYSAEDLALDKYFQDWVLSPDDRLNNAWIEFLSRNPEKTKEVNEAKELVLLSGLSSNDGLDRAYLEGWQRIRSHADHQSNRGVGFLRGSVAAAILIVVAFGTFYFINSRFNREIEFKTDFGETRRVVLEDGTTITLNANSSITVKNVNSTSSLREVYVQGGAFFEVTHTPENTPFVVHVGAVEVHVLGTSFNVDSRRKDIKVLLKTGRVKLKAGDAEEILSPGDEGEFNPNVGKLSVKTLSPDKADENLAWLENQYVMNDLPLSEVAADIEASFGKEVIFDDPALQTKRVSAKVPSNDLNVLLEVVSQALDLKIEEKNGRLYIRAGK